MRPIKLHPSVCVAGKWPHNNRTRYVGGFECRDCGTYVGRDDDRYYETTKYGTRNDIGGPQLTSIEEGL